MVNKRLYSLMLIASAVVIVSFLGGCSPQPADNTDINKRDTADNTGINKRDRPPEEITADQQSQTEKDREITQKIRQAVVDDDSLSTYAHNVKIITVDGMVTLKGPVRSEDEKKTIEEKARRIAGQDKIVSEIDIAPQDQDN
jgi:hyperosmotically inducible protein